MRKRTALCVAAVTAILAAAQTSSRANIAIVVDEPDAKWEHEKTDPPGAESVVLREDPSSGALELLVRYPAGHVFAPHWHNTNERIVLLEGALSIQTGESNATLHPGGFAYLPAKEPQKMACVSSSRCAFYVSWDGKLDFHRDAPPARTK
jgi:quercetin dioxygenase-like cupin family protein